MPHAVDIHVGARIRLRRIECGLTQSELGEKIGVTYQQVQKYEHGSNRMGSSLLWQISLKLDVPISWFFEDIEDDNLPAAARPATSVLRLASALEKLTVPNRVAFMNLVKALLKRSGD